MLYSFRQQASPANGRLHDPAVRVPVPERHARGRGRVPALEIPDPDLVQSVFILYICREVALGHALEVTAGYERLPHGLAVAEGMRFAALLAEREAGASAGLSVRTGSLLDAIGATREAFLTRVPDAASALTPDVLLSAMKSDKKARSGVVRFVLVERPGRWRVVPLGDDVVLAALARWRATLDGEV